MSGAVEEKVEKRLSLPEFMEQVLKDDALKMTVDSIADAYDAYRRHLGPTRGELAEALKGTVEGARLRATEHRHTLDDRSDASSGIDRYALESPGRSAVERSPRYTSQPASRRGAGALGSTGHTGEQKVERILSVSLEDLEDRSTFKRIEGLRAALRENVTRKSKSRAGVLTALKRELRLLDKDGSGFITVSEFERGLAKYLQGVPKRDMELLFVIFDADGSGSISIDEFTTALMDDNNATELINAVRVNARSRSSKRQKPIDVVRRDMIRAERTKNAMHAREREKLRKGLAGSRSSMQGRQAHGGSSRRGQHPQRNLPYQRSVLAEASSRNMDASAGGKRDDTKLMKQRAIANEEDRMTVYFDSMKANVARAAHRLKKMPSAFDRLSLHASKLQVLASASLLRGVFDEFERKEKAERAGRGTAHILGDNLTGKLSLAKFAFALKAFDVPGCPVLSKSDMASLYKRCNNGNYIALIRALYPEVADLAGKGPANKADDDDSNNAREESYSARPGQRRDFARRARKRVPNYGRFDRPYNDPLSAAAARDAYSRGGVGAINKFGFALPEGYEGGGNGGGSGGGGDPLGFLRSKVGKWPTSGAHIDADVEAAGDLAALRHLNHAHKPSVTHPDKRGSEGRNPYMLGGGRPEVIEGPFDKETGRKGVRNVTKLSSTRIPKRMRYRFSKTAVQPPSAFDSNLVTRSAMMPTKHLRRRFVIGCEGGSIGPAMAVLSDSDSPLEGGDGRDRRSRLAYPVAALAVVYDEQSHTQTFYEGHDDDVMCLTAFRDHSESGKLLIATCQKGSRPLVHIWDPETCKRVENCDSGGVIGFVPNGSLDKKIRDMKRCGLPKRRIAEVEARRVPFYKAGICALAVNGDGSKLAAVGCDLQHTMGIWDWRRGRLLAEFQLVQGQPPQVYSLGWCPFLEEAGGARDDFSSKETLVAAGFATIKFFAYKNGECEKRYQTGNGPMPVTVKKGRYGAAPSTRAHHCVCFAMPIGIEEPIAFTGGTNGRVYGWGTSTADLIFCFQAHEGPVLSLRCPYTGSTLFSGGSDGFVKHWMKKKNKKGNALQKEAAIALSRKAKRSTNAPKKPVNVDYSYRLGASHALGEECGGVRALQIVMELKKARGKEDSTAAAGSVGTEDGKVIRAYAMTDRCQLHRIDQPTVLTPAVAAAAAVMHSSPSSAVLMEGHGGPITGLAVWKGPVHASDGRDLRLFVTCGEDGLVYVWNAANEQVVAKASIIGNKCRSVDVMEGSHGANSNVAIGMADGTVAVLTLEFRPGKLASSATQKHAHVFPARLRVAMRWRDCEEAISDIKYSPDGRYLAAASNDNYIDVYDVTKGYFHHCRCHGHSSFVTHLDWSHDSRILQSNCASYEILYWNIAGVHMGDAVRKKRRAQREALPGTQALKKHNRKAARRGGACATCRPLQSTTDTVESDTRWEDYTCVLGFPVMGIWPDGSDGTDVNALHIGPRPYAPSGYVDDGLSHGRDVPDPSGNFVVTADDGGFVKLFNAPCVVEDAPCKVYRGHSSHVTGVRWMPQAEHPAVISVGGHDGGIFIWNLEEDTEGDDEEDEDEE